jgi:hypothetical protein
MHQFTTDSNILYYSTRTQQPSKRDFKIDEENKLKLQKPRHVAVIPVTRLIP